MRHALAACAMLATLTGVAIAQGQDVPIQQHFRGVNCQAKKPAELAIANADALAEVWRIARSDEAPKIDFDKQIVVAAFLGRKNTGGYAVRIQEVRQVGDTAWVIVDVTAPKPNAMVTMVVTSPYALAVIPKPKGKVAFVRAGQKIPEPEAPASQPATQPADEPKTPTTQPANADVKPPLVVPVESMPTEPKTPTTQPASVEPQTPATQPASVEPKTPVAPKQPAEPVPPLDMLSGGVFEYGPWNYVVVVGSPALPVQPRRGMLLHSGRKLPKPAAINAYYRTPWGPIYWIGKGANGDSGWMPKPFRGEDAPKVTRLPDPGAKTKPAAQDRPATQPKPTALSLDEASDGKTVDAQVGQAITIALKGNPTTGFMWTLDGIDGDAVKSAGDIAYQQRPAARGMLGVGGTYTQALKAAAAGSATVRLSYHRARSEPVQTFTVTIRVKTSAGEDK